MRIFLTGGTGYIGRHVAQACLDSGWEVHLLTRPGSVVPKPLDERVTRHDHDTTYESLHAILRHARPDCVVHLASALASANGPQQARQIIDTNILLPTLLLEAMLEAGVLHFVNTGTFWQHYQNEVFRPVDLYAASKQSFYDLLLHYTSNRYLTAVTLKLFDTYGLDDPRRRIVTLLTDAARRNEVLALSGGDQILDLTHVEDVACAYLRAIALVMAAPSGTSATYFVGGERMSLKELSRIVERLSGVSCPPHFGARPYREREIMRPIEPGDDQLPDWVPIRSVEKTVAKLLTRH